MPNKIKNLKNDSSKRIAYKLTKRFIINKPFAKNITYKGVLSHLFLVTSDIKTKNIPSFSNNLPLQITPNISHIPANTLICRGNWFRLDENQISRKRHQFVSYN